jgi:excisionase family DNA binding protein
VDSADGSGTECDRLASMATRTTTGGAPRFLQLADVAEVLNISAAQAYALVRSGELPAIKVGGRGQWRVEASQLEAYIERAYDETKKFVENHPFGRPDEESDGPID